MTCLVCWHLMTFALSGFSVCFAIEFGCRGGSTLGCVILFSLLFILMTLDESGWLQQSCKCIFNYFSSLHQCYLEYYCSFWSLYRLEEGFSCDMGLIGSVISTLTCIEYYCSAGCTFSSFLLWYDDPCQNIILSSIFCVVASGTTAKLSSFIRRKNRI